jgi:hypothetical protein
MSYKRLYTLKKLHLSWPHKLTSTHIKIKPKVSQIKPKTWKIIKKIILKNNANMSYMIE